MTLFALGIALIIIALVLAAVPVVGAVLTIIDHHKEQ